ncbi:MAG: 30S ribosomal protein S21 [Verrucomicrobiae bacterium]|nr:30S ribosomal protein S21 [Verrucomicrobiae bacterium]
MPEVTVKKGEAIDRALKRLKNKLEAEGVMEEIRRLRAFETPTQRSKRKARAKAKRSRNRFRFVLNDPHHHSAERNNPSED